MTRIAECSSPTSDATRVEQGVAPAGKASSDPALLHELDAMPLLLGPHEMQQIFSVKSSRFHQLEQQGAFDDFKVHPAIGPKCYSRILIARYLRQEPLFIPTFGKRRSA